MWSRAKTASYPRRRDRQFDETASTVLAIAGAMLSLVGVLLLVGGYLSAFYGSAFHMLAGAGLMISGILLARRHQAGAWTYMLVVAVTINWSLRDVQTGSMLISRLIGPTLLLAMIAILMPVLSRWRPRFSFAVFAALATGTAAFGFLSLPAGPLSQRTAAMSQLPDVVEKGVPQ